MARLRVDMVACDGIGQCALVAPGLVSLDRWGYPVVRADGAEGAAEADRADRADSADDAAAHRAVRACPRRALWLESVRRPEVSVFNGT